jgi:hypothetical protein
MRKPISLQQATDYDRASADELMERLKRHIQKPGNSGYVIPSILHAELLQRSRDFTEIISSIKNVQWRIVNYAVLLDAALAGIPSIIGVGAAPDTIKISVTIVLGFLNAFVLWVAARMMIKTEADLAFYRAHGRNNDILLDATTGIQHAAAVIIERTKKEFRGTSDYEIASRRNRQTFTVWFYVTLGASAAVSAAIMAGLTWVRR